MVEKLYYIIIVGSFVFFLLTFFIVYLSIVQNQKKTFYKQELSKAQLEIKEQTLKHIAFELHDNLGQIASLIKINLNTLQLDDAEKAAEKIEATKELTRQLITDLKSLSISLNSDRISQLGLVKGLHDEAERLNRTGLFTAVLEITEPIPLLPENSTIILYRMVQEVLNNMVKHSQATQVFISLQVVENLFTLVIRDNGVGFNPEDKMKSGGSGLLNLQSRARLIQATFSIQSSPGEGTRISIALPLDTHAKHTSH
jgi:hypothetical protein